MAKRKDHAIFRPGFLRWEIKNGKLDRMPQCAGFLKLNSQMIQKLNTLLGCKLRKGTPNERQKCVGTSSPPQTTLNFEQNGWKWVLFWVKLCWGGVRGRRDEPKAYKKNLIMVQLLGTVFPAVQRSFDLHCWIERKLLAFFFLPHCVNCLHPIKAFLCHVTI